MRSVDRSGLTIVTGECEVLDWDPSCWLTMQEIQCHWTTPKHVAGIIRLLSKYPLEDGRQEVHRSSPNDLSCYKNQKTLGAKGDVLNHYMLSIL